MRIFKYIFCFLLVLGLIVPLVQFTPEINSNSVLLKSPSEFFYKLLPNADAGRRLRVQYQLRRRRGATGGGLTCTLYEEMTTDAEGYDQGTGNNTYYAGTYYVAPEDMTVCRVDFKIRKMAGDVSGYTYNADVWDMSGGQGGLPGSPVTNGTSDNVSGSAITGTAAFVAFSWTGNKPSLTSGTLYSITYRSDTVSGSNYTELRANDSNTAPLDSTTEDLARWWNDGSVQARYNGSDACFKIYTMQ